MLSNPGVFVARDKQNNVNIQSRELFLSTSQLYQAAVSGLLGKMV